MAEQVLLSHSSTWLIRPAPESRDLETWLDGGFQVSKVSNGGTPWYPMVYPQPWYHPLSQSYPLRDGIFTDLFFSLIWEEPHGHGNPWKPSISADCEFWSFPNGLLISLYLQVWSNASTPWKLLYPRNIVAQARADIHLRACVALS